MIRNAAVALGVMCAAPAWAQHTIQSEHRVQAGLARVSYASFFNSPSDPLVFEASWAWLARPDVISAEIGAGFRAAPARPGITLPVELFARARLEGRVGYWRPAVGPEFGVSGLAGLSPRRDRLPGDLDAVEAERFSPFYGGMDAAPLRFAFGRIWASALEIGIGTGLLSPGGTVRLKVTLLSVGYAL